LFAYKRREWRRERRGERQIGKAERKKAKEGREFFCFFLVIILIVFFISVIIYVRDLVNYNLVHVVCKTLLISPCIVKTII